MSKSLSRLFIGTSGAVAFFAARTSLFVPGEPAGTRLIVNDVIESVRVGSALKDDSYHAFPDIVDNYVGMAHKFQINGGDGVKRRLYQLSGSLNNSPGIFEWIVEPGKVKKVPHRRFIKDGEITGKPNQTPRVRSSK